MDTMAGYKVFLSEDSFISGDRILLDPSESHHLCRVLRAKLGTSVQVLDGKGGLYQTQLVQALPKAAELAVLSRVNCERPSLDLHLVIGVLKPKAMDQVLKRAVEIGVTRIYPVLTEYGSFSLDAHQSLIKASKWRTALIEACKQSGNVFLPELMHTATLKSFLQEIGSNVADSSLGIVASTETGNDYMIEVLDCLKNGTDSIYFAVGPEGDFSPSEYRALATRGFLSSRLGAHVLRSETAVCYGLAVLDQHRRLRTKNESDG